MPETLQAEPPPPSSPPPPLADRLTQLSRWRWPFGGAALLLLAMVVVAVVRACLPATVEAVGTVERRVLELAAPVSERIVEIKVRPGQRVVKGEVLVRLDSEVAGLELKAVSASLSEADAVLTAAQREYERTLGLAQSRVVSSQDLDRAKRAFDQALATQAERAARVAQAKRRYEDLTVRSGAAGVVDQLPFEIGERVPAGGVVAVVLADDAPWVRLWLPARAVARLRPGARAQVEIEGMDGAVRGRLEDVSREPEFTPHFALTERERDHLVYEARVVLENAPRELRPGIPATVRLRLGEPMEAAKAGP
jgi:HlyD family secretion protein